MATDATIERCFDRLKLIHREWMEEDEFAALKAEWVEHLGDYSEAAVLDATDVLALDDKFPSLNRIVSATQDAQRAIREEHEFVWGKNHPEDDPTNIDPAGRQRLIALMHGQGDLSTKSIDLPKHDHRYDRKTETPADGVARCPLCSKHDHRDGAAYCDECRFDDQGIVLGDPNKVTNICRHGCDRGLIEIWIDAKGVEMPAGVKSGHTAVKPCPRCSPDAYEAWQNGIWGEQAKRKKKSKRVNASATDGE